MKSDCQTIFRFPKIYPGALLALLTLFAGCATAPKSTGPKYTFFPAPPDAPRIQYLTSFSSERDLGRGNASLMDFLTGTETPSRPILKPYGLATHGNNLYVCDTAAGFVMRLDLVAKRLYAIAPVGPGAYKLPLNIAVDDNGWLYVADSLRNQVIITDTNENFVATLCDRTTDKPRDVALSPDRIYVGDVAAHRVHVFDKATRALLFDIPSATEATNIASKLFQPSNIALDTAQNLYVSDVGAYRIQVYDRTGKYVRTIGKYGDNYGEFSRPKGVAVDREGIVYVVDAAGQMVEMFDNQGHLLMWFGEPSGSKVGFALPTKVAIDYDDVDLFKSYAAPDFKVDHLILVVSQYGPRKVSVFGFGHKK